VAGSQHQAGPQLSPIHTDIHCSHIRTCGTEEITGNGGALPIVATGALRTVWLLVVNVTHQCCALGRYGRDVDVDVLPA
jgi:hypothetical protein